MNADEKIKDSKHKETEFKVMTHFDDPLIPYICDIPSYNFRAKTVKDMAKILCPKGTANCEKCSKDYKCNVNFSQLSQLFDGGCRILGPVALLNREMDELLVRRMLEKDKIESED